jgi:hypothetical protein
MMMLIFYCLVLLSVVTPNSANFNEAFQQRIPQKRFKSINAASFNEVFQRISQERFKPMNEALLNNLNRKYWLDKYYQGPMFRDPYKNPKLTLDNIFYLNLPRRVDRDKSMMRWLPNLSKNYNDIPIHRVKAIPGNSSAQCDVMHNDPRECRGIMSILMNNIRIFDSNIGGDIFMVLEDDIQKFNPVRVEAAMNVVPNDWDVIRFDCYGTISSHLQKSVLSTNPFLLKTNYSDEVKAMSYAEQEKNEYHWYCGGTHAVIYRKKALKTLKKIYSSKPYIDMDCALNTNKINSYCFNDNIVKLDMKQAMTSDKVHMITSTAAKIMNNIKN